VRKRALRTRFLAATAVGLAVVGWLAAPAFATEMFGKAECVVSGSFRVLPIGSNCWVASATFSASQGSAVALSAASVVDDSAHAVDTGVRSEYLAAIHCYDVNNAVRYGLGATRNIWRGANPAGLYLKGVFLPPATGTYTCNLEVAQVALSGETQQTYLMRGAYLNAAVRPVGASSGGPNLTPWDALPPDHPDRALLVPGATIDGGRLQWTVPAGVTTLNLVGMTNLSSCSFNSDTVSPNPCAGHISSGTATMTLRLLAWQTIAGSTNQCAPPFTASVDISISPVTHHYTVSQSGTYTLTAAAGCTRTVVIKTNVTNTGSTYAYAANQNTAVGATN
jgi:hypothetical protein